MQQFFSRIEHVKTIITTFDLIKSIFAHFSVTHSKILGDHLAHFSGKFKKLEAYFRPLILDFCLNAPHVLSTGIIERTLERLELFSTLFSNYYHDLHVLYSDENSSAERILFEFNGLISSFNSIDDIFEVNFFSPQYTCVIDGQGKKELADYERIARDIVNKQSDEQSTLSKIRRVIAEMDNPGVRSDFPFVAVVGPSFMGKTQLAVSLAQTQIVVYYNPSNNKQPIYSNFDAISSELDNLLRSDLCVFKFKRINYFKKDHRNTKFSTLGLLLALFETCAEFDFAQSSWMEFYSKIPSIAYTKLSPTEFVEKYKALRTLHPQMKSPVIFIDEFSNDRSLLFLRTLCVCVGLPCILASTNAKVSNMLISYKDLSRSDKSPWCTVITSLPHTYIETVLDLIIVSGDGIDASLLRFFNCNDMEFRCRELLNFMGLEGLSESQKSIIDNIVKLIVSQAKSALQGISFVVLDELIQILKVMANGNQSLNIWAILIDNITNTLMSRKRGLRCRASLVFSLSSFSLNPNMVLINNNSSYREGPASTAVNQNLYYFGSRRTSRVLKLSRTSDTLLEADSEIEYRFKSYMSNFSEDVFTHTVLWNLLHRLNATDSVRLMKSKVTVAKLVESIYREVYFPVNFRAIYRDSNYQEHLALLALSHSSHQNVNGVTDGLNFLKEFAVHVQILGKDLTRMDGLLRDFVTGCPPTLAAFLESLNVPYLVPQSTTETFPTFLVGSVMRSGTCQRAANSLGFDLYFSVNDSFGYVECKNLNCTVSRNFVKGYILRAITIRSPLTLFLVNRAGTSLRSRQGFNKFQQRSTQESKTKQDETAGPLTFEEMLQEFPRTGTNFGMNVYSLTYSSRRQQGRLNMKFNVLHESENAEGVFVIIESNCNLCPIPTQEENLPVNIANL